MAAFKEMPSLKKGIVMMKIWRTRRIWTIQTWKVWMIQIWKKLWLPVRWHNPREVVELELEDEELQLEDAVLLVVEVLQVMELLVQCLLQKTVTMKMMMI